ncbi:MAG: rod shape-determining protein MreD [Legionellaceae bacterium]|nr:rod shape-determining protein MreD [Legionellaceae bacterium]
MISKLRVSLAVVVMLLLAIFPFAQPFYWFQPCGLLLLVIYLQCTLPKQLSVSLILLLGLSLDFLASGVLGQQAFALLATAWVVSKRAQRFRLFSVPQQLFGIAAFSGLYHLILMCIQLLLGYPVLIWSALFSVFISVLCWPFMQYVSDRFFFGGLPKRA